MSRTERMVMSVLTDKSFASRAGSASRARARQWGRRKPPAQNQRPEQVSVGCHQMRMMANLAAIEGKMSSNDRRLVRDMRNLTCRTQRQTLPVSWENGRRLRSSSGSLYFPNNRKGISSGGRAYYPRGGGARSSSGRLSYPNGKRARDRRGWYNTRGDTIAVDDSALVRLICQKSGGRRCEQLNARIGHTRRGPERDVVLLRAAWELNP
mgnify:CR=1 FL=1